MTALSKNIPDRAAIPPGQLSSDRMFWTVPPEQRGRTIHIVGGGPSFSADYASRLRGQVVIALNASYQSLRFSPDYVLFADDRIWNDFHADLLAQTGRVIGLFPGCLDQRITLMRRDRVMRIGERRDTLPFEWTILASGLVLAAFLGASKVILWGADGRRIGDRAHHHPEYRWGVKEGCWNNHRINLYPLVAPLRARGIEVVNASPGSAIPFWPIVDPDAVLKKE